MDGYERLAAAVVEQAIVDYRWALRRLYRHPFDINAEKIVNDCERFFQNEIAMYSDIDGESIMRAIKERVGAEI